MKPLKLVMKSFGSYAGVQKIDFTKLKNRSMFLIHGPTGSGKTTILDAICYALYGETSGNERNGKSMRSQFASLDEITEVEFDFEIKEDFYKIKRIPEQERAKKQGEGTTIQLAEAVLWKKINGKMEVVESRQSKVTQKIEEIIGFQSNQFRRVIMLPQGKFRELLIAKSEERQQILEKIFHTEEYKNIEEFFRNKAKKLRQEIQNKKTEKNTILNRVKCYEDDLEYKEILFNEKVNTKDKINTLEKLLIKDREKLKNIEENLKIKIKELKKSEKELEDAKRNNEKLLNKGNTEKTLKKIEKLKEEIDIKRKRIEAARKAVTLIEIEKIAKHRSEDRSHWEKQIKDTNNNINILKEKILEKEKEFNKQKEKNKEVESIQKKILQLESLKNDVKALNNLKDEITCLEKDLNNIEKNMEYSIFEIKEKQNKIDEIISNVNKLRDYENKLMELNINLEKEINILRKLQHCKNLESEYKKICENYNIEKEKLDKIHRNYTIAKSEYTELQSLWSQGQAFILAENLKTGEACPVCGSKSHPHKAEKKQNIPTEEKLKYRKEQMEILEKKKENQKNLWDKLSVDKNSLENSIIDIKKDLKDYYNLSIDALNKSIEETSNNIKNLEKSIKEIDKLKIQLEDEKKYILDMKNKLENLQKEYAHKKEEYHSKKGKLDYIDKNIPKDIKIEKDLNKSIKDLNKKSYQLISDFEKCENELQNLNTELAQLKAVYKTAIETFEDIDKKYKKEKEEFKTRMINEGFKKYQCYSQAKEDMPNIKSLEKEVKDYDASFCAAKDNYENALKESEGLEVIEIKEIYKRNSSLEKERMEILSEKNNYENKIKDNEIILKDVLNLESLIEKKEKHYYIIGDLSDTANGKNLFGMTFERFVLSILLDDILIAANYRLNKMSDGRYSLNRTLQRDRKNAQGGLELEVFDNNTGMARPVATLSGGESFKASLSLALGLSDVVQSYSGGISLNTMFIDEGFGSLDPESLDNAIKTLMELQQKGRIVGIISHVPELKERIDARLEVIPTERGSIAEFKVL
ncbi:nuclease SbcCD subunit C [Clostridium acetireducens DSM 10703]|uniref:Nuclease SbcCD subunit C n=1 Tax=Clostridium acetireducens DSM 10703 TaxID=1121290 RepID=A0A1E8F2M0_9CLOT|nr:AAA family ATPase [Clostridium acetireducens]OFI07624.1 nuclease SbcCD subunit C [Clostridium acetireducens DSM 10703]